MVAITNTTVFPQFFPQNQSSGDHSACGPAWTNSALGQLVVGINNARATFTNADGLVGAFEHVGDILSTLQLTEQSPFIQPVLMPLVICTPLVFRNGDCS